MVQQVKLERGNKMIGKWNKSVILTYIGLSISLIGISLIIAKVDIKYAFICLMFAGICDLFDGTVARRCKRTKEEKAFGIELDSLVDVVSFISLPLVILASINNNFYYLPILIIYAIFAIARLADFNITVPKDNKPIKYYEGLPATYAALIFPLVYLLSYVINTGTFIIIYNIISLIVAILFVIRVKVPKPRLVSSIILFVVCIVVTIVYLVV